MKAASRPTLGQKTNSHLKLTCHDHMFDKNYKQKLHVVFLFPLSSWTLCTPLDCLDSLESPDPWTPLISWTPWTLLAKTQKYGSKI